MSNSNRPLSPFMIGPHYRPQLTSMLSILHRITGAALGFGGVFFAAWLFAALAGEQAFQQFAAFRASWLGQLMQFGWLFSFVYHFFNGLRHLNWDGGRGFELKSAYRSGYAVFIASVLLTLLIWNMPSFGTNPLGFSLLGGR